MCPSLRLHNTTHTHNTFKTQVKTSKTPMKHFKNLKNLIIVDFLIPNSWILMKVERKIKRNKTNINIFSKLSLWNLKKKMKFKFQISKKAESKKNSK